jgi:diadenosine tetraphosphatase ApaH/serine/threonine PP2A family protein phosphatase
LQAFISDIHGNIEALQAVLEHISGQGADEIYCLGDVVGYGPDPRQCLKIATSFAGCLMGNHEKALLSSAEDFNPQARRALDWTRDQINSDAFPREENRALWNFIDSLPDIILGDDFMLVHGSPRDRIHEYIVPEDIYDSVKMKELFDLVEKPFCFVGHSHLPGVYLENSRFIALTELGSGFSIPDGKRAIVNVGSVGQPRDGDSRSCYATLEKGIVRFHRVAYDVDRTFEKIVGTKRLPMFLAARLKEGK